MSIDPKILKRLHHDESFVESQRSGSRRVKIERGQNWIVRFLPARMGADGLWYARIARHWLNRLPIVCPRNTAEDFGGNPECECPVCLVADELNESADEVISKFGYKAKANAQFLTYCIVWEKDGVEQPMAEVLNPYEFSHYRSTWEELKGFYLAGGRKCPDSVFDYERGNDFSVSKTIKGLRLDKQDSSPIFDPNNRNYAEWIKKLESAMKAPKVVVPNHEQLQIFAAKVHEAATRGGGGGAEDDDAPRGRRGVRGGGGRSYDDAPRGRGYDDDDDAAPRGRGRSRPAAPEDDDDVPFDPPPARSAARAAVPARRATPEPEPGEDDVPFDPPPARPAARAAVPARRATPEPEPGEDDVPFDPPPARPAARAAVPARRATPEPEPGEDDVPFDPPPARPAARAAVPAPRRGASAPADEEAGRSAPLPRRAPALEPEVDPNYDPDPDGSNDSPNEGAPPARDEAPARRALPPTARRAAASRGESVKPPQGDAEEDDPLPEDDVDPVPPAAKAGAAEDAPPPVARRGGQGSAIAERIAKLNKNA